MGSRVIKKDELFAALENRTIQAIFIGDGFSAQILLEEPGEECDDLYWQNNSLTIDWEHAKITDELEGYTVMLPNAKIIFNEIAGGEE